MLVRPAVRMGSSSGADRSARPGPSPSPVPAPSEVMAGSKALLLPVALLALAGCADSSPQREGQRCGGDFGACASGLRCSEKKKRCYRPVDCDLLARRTRACLQELVSVYAPASAKLVAQKRAELLERIGERLRTEVVDHCRFDAAAYRKKHGVAPTDTKSYGEDPRAKEISACLGMQSCRPFARCLLGVARLVGPRRVRPGAVPVFPLERPRPASPASSASDAAGKAAAGKAAVGKAAAGKAGAGKAGAGKAGAGKAAAGKGGSQTPPMRRRAVLAPAPRPR